MNDSQPQYERTPTWEKKPIAKVPKRPQLHLHTAEEKKVMSEEERQRAMQHVREGYVKGVNSMRKRRSV